MRLFVYNRAWKAFTPEMVIRHSPKCLFGSQTKQPVLIRLVSLLSTDLRPEVSCAVEYLLHEARKSKCETLREGKRGPWLSSETESRAEATSLPLLGPASVYVPTITCLLFERVNLKSESSAEAA